jgi:hypothetical protein
MQCKLFVRKAFSNFDRPFCIGYSFCKLENALKGA